MKKQLITDLLITAFEGGSNYWYMLDGNVLSDFRQYKILPSDSMTDAVITGVMDYNREVDILDAEDPEEKIGVLSLKGINEGIELMKADHSEHYDNAIDDNWDAETADVFLQYCVLKEIVYG